MKLETYERIRKDPLYAIDYAIQYARQGKTWKEYLHRLYSGLDLAGIFK